MMPTWGWIVLLIGAACFGWTLGADWLWRDKPDKKSDLPPADVIGRPKKNRYCSLVGCEVNRPHSHTEDLIRRMKDK